MAQHLPRSHQTGIWIATRSAQIIELIPWIKLHARSQPTRDRLATLWRLKFWGRITVRMAAQMKDRTGSSARMVILALLEGKVYGGALTFEVRMGWL